MTYTPPSQLWVGRFVRGRFTYSLGQSGPGQGSDGDPDKGQSGTWSGVPDEGACRLPDRGEWPL